MAAPYGRPAAPERHRAPRAPRVPVPRRSGRPPIIVTIIIITIIIIIIIIIIVSTIIIIIIITITITIMNIIIRERRLVQGALSRRLAPVWHHGTASTGHSLCLALSGATFSPLSLQGSHVSAVWRQFGTLDPRLLIA